MNVVSNIITKNIHIIDECNNINDFLNCNENERIQDMKFFKKLIEKIL